MNKSTFLAALKIAQSMLTPELYAQYEKAMQIAYLNASIELSTNELEQLTAMRKIAVEYAPVRTARMQYLNDKLLTLNAKLNEIEAVAA